MRNSVKSRERGGIDRFKKSIFLVNKAAKEPQDVVGFGDSLIVDASGSYAKLSA
ncbi:hypothetical protein Lpp123_13795 [Lacticaseibacillus paracasei subsp. paracasei Lpp123]|uniref:Uncharacterized protein n=1 Tax=Lacticaseibacillus paracasei subsp. paracasei Lpp123 TaxID=1256201 RepID=A0A829GD48_LACPA|nr:hypothetical protein Lpp123_13795 [Lacticaseibacillus paracasei subsp. paracasei Lpp123]